MPAFVDHLIESESDADGTTRVERYVALFPDGRVLDRVKPTQKPDTWSFTQTRITEKRVARRGDEVGRSIGCCA